MKIIDCVLTKSGTGFYFDDQMAIKKGAVVDGFCYLGNPVTAGFNKIRIPGEAVSIQLVLEDGLVACGDACAVQYSGTGGRDSLFLASEYIPFMEEYIKPLLIGEELTSFRSLAEKYDNLEINGKRIHTAIRYGVTQALLRAVALVRRKTIAEVIREEYNIADTTYNKVPIFSQSGDDRYSNADKMILKEADALPHALINSVAKIGNDGEVLAKYLEYLKKRIIEVRVREDYNPIIHIDVYGTIGMIFNNDLEKIAIYLKSLVDIVSPFMLRVEGPVDTGDREGTMVALRDLRKILDVRGILVELVADEWCNTLEDIIYFADNSAGHMLQIKAPDLGGVNNSIEAVLYCNKIGIGGYLGGTCNETNVSTEVTTNIAIATNAKQILAKPGMGVDEALMICRNEMDRVLGLINSRRK
jgi:methylaspartate ammonia-lyase